MFEIRLKEEANSSLKGNVDIFVKRFMSIIFKRKLYMVFATWLGIVWFTKV